MCIEDNNDPVRFYLREVCTSPPLTRAEEIELSRHVLARDEQAESAGMRLIEGNLAMVVSIAERHRSAGIHVLDLIQKGNDGLLLTLNPMTHLIDAFRAVIVDGRVPGSAFALTFAASAALFVAAWVVFHRAEFEFAENL